MNDLIKLFHLFFYKKFSKTWSFSQIVFDGCFSLNFAILNKSNWCFVYFWFLRKFCWPWFNFKKKSFIKSKFGFTLSWNSLPFIWIQGRSQIFLSSGPPVWIIHKNKVCFIETWRQSWKIGSCFDLFWHFQHDCWFIIILEMTKVAAILQWTLTHVPEW